MTDFGFARHVKKSELLNTNCGSYVYTAPEVMEGKQYDGAQADIWSMGRLLGINSVQLSLFDAFRETLSQSCIYLSRLIMCSNFWLVDWDFFLSCTKIKFEIDPQTTEFSKKKNGKNNDNVITVKKLSLLENFRQSIGIC